MTKVHVVSESTSEEAIVSPQDVFDRIDQVRLRQVFDKVAVKRPLATVGIRRPKAHEWVQAHPQYRAEWPLFAANEEGMNAEWYFPVGEEVLAVLEDLSPVGVKNTTIFWLINRKKNTFIWPVVGANSDGRQNEWHSSMYEMLSVHANGRWCRIESGEMGYNPTIAEGRAACP